MSLLSGIEGFTWDKGNRDKNFNKHKVTNEECEEAFFDSRKRISGSSRIVDGEERYILVGKTKSERLLFVVFTVRDHELRVISARDLNKREWRLYEETV